MRMNKMIPAGLLVLASVEADCALAKQVKMCATAEEAKELTDALCKDVLAAMNSGQFDVCK